MEFVSFYLNLYTLLLIGSLNEEPWVGVKTDVLPSSCDIFPSDKSWIG